MRLSIARTSVLAVAAWLLIGLVGGCSSNNGGGPTGTEGSQPLSVTNIILDPKSPAPGDTVTLTVIIESSSLNTNDFPKVTWSSSSGTLLESNLLSVRWQAPDTPQLATVSVQAKNSVSTSSKSATLWVGDEHMILPGDAGQVFFMPNRTDFYYYHTTDIAKGLKLYQYVDSMVSNVVPAAQAGQLYRFAPDQLHTAFQLQGTFPNAQIQPVNIYVDDVAGQTVEQITTDLAKGLRRQQFTSPRFSPDGSLVAYQGFLPSSEAVDSFQVFTYNVNTSETRGITNTHGNLHNFYPSFSSDGQWFTFISDRSGLNRWELYALPITAGVVDTMAADVVKLTSTSGQITSGTPLNLAEPLTAWDPNASTPVLALLLPNKSLMFITMTAQGAVTQTIGGLVGQMIQEMVWSDDGSMLALSSGSVLFTVPVTGGDATMVRTVASTDVLRDLRLGPNKRYMVYRVTRSSSSWFELLDMTGTNLQEPVVISSVSPSVDSAYRRAMSMSPVFGNGGLLYMLVPVSTGRPGVAVSDISNAMQ